MKRYRLTESNLRNMIHEAVVSVLKEAGKENRLRNMVREAIVDTLREEEEKKYKYLDDEQLSKKPKVVGKIDLPDEDWGAKAKRKISLNRDRKRR